MVNGQNGVAGLIVPVMKHQPELEDATVLLQPMEDFLAHMEKTQQLKPLMTFL
jgi:hypothetical protein